MIESFRARVPFVVVGFLFIYIFILQPIKDWFILRLPPRVQELPHAGFWALDNRLSRVVRLADVLDFLGWLVRTWQIPHLRLVVFGEQDWVYFFGRGKKPRRLALRDEIPEAWRRELAAEGGLRPSSSFSTKLREYLKSRKVGYIAPVLFRERLVGLLGLAASLAKSQQAYLGHVLHRIGLALENELLEKTVPRSEFLRQEFRLAERVERQLAGSSRYNLGRVVLQKLDSAWEKKHFSAIFGCSRARAADDELYFAMLLRLSVASTRSNALELFATQGFFYALSKTQRQLAELVAALHSSIRNQEGQNATLEGFLLAVQPQQQRLKMAAFGRHLAYRDVSGWTWIPESPPMGSEDFSGGLVVELTIRKEIVLSMREYPLLLLTDSLP
ncbi:MAG: hypothetical protein N2Z22_06890 [Turneriella sp.]|nr:hypothetical protein [Turneriella sp.]